MSSSSISSASSSTTATFLAALVLNGAVFGGEIAAFTILRTRFKQIYEPRTITPIKSQRVAALSGMMLLWPWTVMKIDYRDVQRINGTDAYFFLRFLRMMIRVFVPTWIITWAVLMPVTSVGTTTTGLSQFNFGNIPTTEQDRYAAHIICVWLFSIWLWWNIKYEMDHFVVIRQRHLIDPVHSSTVQANTILVTGVPAKYLSEAGLTRMYSHLPGGIKKIWLNRCTAIVASTKFVLASVLWIHAEPVVARPDESGNLKELPNIYDRRLDACSKLESAETKLFATASKIRRKQLKADAKAAKKSGSEAQSSSASVSPTQPMSNSTDVDVDVEHDLSLVEKMVPKEKRPTHRLPLSFMPFSLPFIGTEVDSIDWARKEILETDELLAKGQQVIANENLLPEDVNGDGVVDIRDRKAQTYPPLNSAFITFNKQIAAHMAAQMLTHHEPYRMADKYAEVAPDDVLWGNIGMNPYEQKARMLLSYAATAGLIILWAFPVAFVGIVSNIQGLCTRESWLAWLCKIPSEVIGIIQGILPAVLLALLNMFLPIILRLFGRFEGIPTRNQLELSLMTRFFIFQVIHNFLIVTLASGLIAALPQLLENPTSIPSLLAQYLPEASIFFLTYILLQGLSGSASGFLRVVTLLLYYVKLFILGSTPRSIYNIKYAPQKVAWGTLFPSVTLLVVIATGYSIISPVINGLAVMTFVLYYLLYKYRFTYQISQPPSSDTGGLFFPKAMQHIFVGMYVQQVCLAALFFLARNESKQPSAIPEGSLMVVLIVFTACFNLYIYTSYGPLEHALPLSLADKTYQDPSLDTADAEVMTIDERASGEKRRGTSGSDRLVVDVNAGDKVITASSAEPTSTRRRGTQSRTVDSGDDLAPISPRSMEEGTRNGGSPRYSEDDGTREARETDGETEPMMPPRKTIDWGFAQPAASRPQRIVWYPRDSLGLSQEETAACTDAGVEVSTAGADMDEKGRVTVRAAPPDLGVE